MPKVTAGGAVPVAPVQVTESTVRVDVDAMMRERGQPADPATQERHGRTQLFAMNDRAGQATAEKTPPEAFAAPDLNATPQAGTAAPGVRHERTQLFALNGQKSKEAVADTTLPPDPALRQTLMFGGVSPVQGGDTAPGLPGVNVDTDSAEAPVDSTLPHLSPAGQSQTTQPRHVMTPPGDSEPSLEGLEPTDAGGEGARASSSQDLPAMVDEAGDSEQAFAAIESSTRRRNTIAVIVLLLAVLSVGAALVWQLSRQMNSADPVRLPLPKTGAPPSPAK